MYYSNKKKIYRLTSKIYKYLRENRCEIGKLRPIGKYFQTGYYLDSEDGPKIVVDYRFEILTTLVHECIHHFHIDWKEERVLKEEHIVMALLSKKQAKNLIKAFARTF